METDFSFLEKKIDIVFQDKKILERALTHRSYLNENRQANLEHNERSEFLGDAVLELVVSDYLFRQFLKEPEGYLTSLRAALVNANTLSAVAEELGLEKFLLLSRGEAKDFGRGRRYILADSFEAIVGAIYLDQGYSTAERFIKINLIEKKLQPILEGQTFRDAKSSFQEKAQANVGITPNYRVLSEWGPDHNKQFRVGVFLAEELVAEGEGLSKQEAETEAAKAAILAKEW